MEDFLLGDIIKQETAIQKLDQLLTGFLIELHAWRYKENWEDLRQIILLKVIAALKKGQLRDMKAFVAYVRTTTRRAFFDLFNERKIDFADITEPQFDRRADDASAIHAAINSLPDNLKKSVQAVYIMDLKYTTAAELTGVPLGTLKRYLQQGLKQLRTLLNGSQVYESTSTHTSDRSVING